MSDMLRRLGNEAGLRFLMRRRAAFVVAVLTMGLALGANTVVFAVLKAFLLSSFALPEADRLFQIAPLRELPGRGEVVFADAWPNYELLRETQRSFEDVACMLQSTSSWDDEGEARPLQAALVTASFFSTTRVQPMLGRAFEEEEEGPSPAPVVIVAHALWQGALAGDRDVVGRVMMINGAPHTVIGVMPPGFVHPLPTDIWLPFDVPAQQRVSITGARTLGIYGRLKDGVSRDVASAELDAFTRRSIEVSADNEDFRYSLRSIIQVLLPGADRTVLFVQAGALVLILLAILNLASLLIAWGFERRTEMALRLALGAGPGRIVRMLVLQSLLVVFAGAAAGLVIARIAIPAVRQLDVTPSLALFMAHLQLDTGVLLWSAATALIAGALSGVLPSLFGRHVAMGETLRSSSRNASMSPAAVRWQKGMVLAQATLTVVILSAAALIAVSFRNLSHVPDGFESTGRVVARVILPPSEYATHERRAEFGARLLAALEREGELISSGFASTLPVGDVPWGGRFFTELPGGDLSEEPLLLHIRRISHDYLGTMGIPLLSGRGFTPQDDAAHPPAIIISRAVAERLWPGEDPLGKPLYRVIAGNPPQRMEVIGIAGNVMDAGYTAPPGEAAYVHWPQVSIGRMSIVVTPRTSMEAGVAALRRALRAADPVRAASDVVSLPALVRQTHALPRLQSILLAAFALVAIGIATLGSYGVMSQLVATREREFAVRMVFGAMPASIGSSVLAQAASLALAGTLAGLAIVWLLGSLLRPFVFGIQPRSLGISILVAALTLLLVAAATLAPALRATRVDVTLRS